MDDEEELINPYFFDNYSSSASDISFTLVYLRCLICYDSPRIIFKKKDNTIVIKAYCLNHKEENEKDIYSLDEFINKYEMVKGEENSELEEEENKKENNLSGGRILPYNSVITSEEKKIRKSTNICEKHNVQYIYKFIKTKKNHSLNFVIAKILKITI